MHAKKPLALGSSGPLSHYWVYVFQRAWSISSGFFVRKNRGCSFCGCGIRAGINGAKAAWLEDRRQSLSQCNLIHSAFQEQLQTFPRTGCACNLGMSQLEQTKVESLCKLGDEHCQGPAALGGSLVLVLCTALGTVHKYSRRWTISLKNLAQGFC